MKSKPRKPQRETSVAIAKASEPNTLVRFIARTYQRGADSGHGDLRWFGAGETALIAAPVRRTTSATGASITF